MTTAEYVRQNWEYFQQSGWKSVSRAIEHYQRKPQDLENEKTGVAAHNGKMRDSSTLRAAKPNAHKDDVGIMTRIRQFYAQGMDSVQIQLAMGKISFSGQAPDYLAISGINQICRTGPPIAKKLTLKEV